MRETEPAAAPAQRSDCQLDWMRRNGLWTAADDAVVLERYGPGALTDHWYCCRAQPWQSSALGV